ncbi:hypothetical protein TCAL_13385 [Tigriopus californicus]|uniref:C2H2-type domain-containing protein n=1 Tax=Tigriopus californicus TaxID=6832 RepID=A0A553PSW1_TIGCA|nr:hypothetical protein TCAL_13385 [Tigriopus californicus]
MAANGNEMKLHVPTKKIDTVMYCPICKVTSSSPAGHVAHLQGKKHFQKINELRGIPPSNMVVPPTVVPGAKVKAPPQPQQSAFYCKSCNVNLYTKDTFDAHFQNPPHKKIGGAQALKKTPTQTFHCKVCSETLRNKFFYDQHMNSPEHRVAVEGSKSLSGSNSSSSLSKLNQQVLLQPPPPFGEIKVGVFWDLENCQLSSKIDIAGVVQKLKKDYGHKGVFDQFVGACNMDNHRRIALTMQELGMDILPVLNNKKNAADDLLKY